MVRKILLGGIMLVSVLIVIVAFQRHRARDNRPADNQTLVTPRPPQGIRLIKYDKENNPILIVTGVQAEQPVEKGPIEITQPRLTFPKDKNSPTTITADIGHLEGQGQDKMDEGWLQGHVVMTVMDKNAGDNTVITCDRMEYHGTREQGVVTVRWKSRAVSSPSAPTWPVQNWRRTSGAC